MPGNLPGYDDKFDLARIAKERFGIDISPEARAQAESEARTRQEAASGSAAAQQLFAGMAGKPGSADAGIADQRKAIEADTTGAFDARRKRAAEDIGFGDEQVDRARKQTIQERDYTNENIEEDEETNAKSQLSGLARTAAGKLGVNVPPDTSYRTIKKVAPWLVEKLQADRASARSASMDGPNDQLLLATVSDIARGALPLNAPLPTSGVSAKAQAMAGQMLGAAKGRENTQVRASRLLGEPGEKVGGFENTLNHVDQLQMELPGFNTGYLRNKVDRLRWLASMDDPQRSLVKAKLSQLLSQYTLEMSGKASSEQEAQRLAESIPTANDDEDTLLDKMQSFKEWTGRNLGNWLDFYGRRGLTVDEDKNMAISRGWLQATPEKGLQPQYPTEGPGVMPKTAQTNSNGGTVAFSVDGRKANLPNDPKVIEGFLAKYPNAKRVQ